MGRDALPFPVAVLQRRSHNAKSAKDLHDAAYFGWEVGIRLAASLSPGVGSAERGSQSLGAMVKTLSLKTTPLQGTPLREVARLLGQEGLGRPLGSKETHARGVVEALPAYRNRVIGHGSVRARDYYERAGRILLEGLAAAWAQEVFWPADTRLCHLESVEVSASGQPVGRVLDLMGEAPLIRDPAGTLLPEALLPNRLYASQGASWTSLHPWLLYLDEDDRERVLCFDALHRTHARYLDYASGTALSGRALEEHFPGTVEALREARADASEAPEAASPGLAEGEERFGDYIIEGRLGQGAMGIVYLARQAGLERRVALKVVSDALNQNATALARFRREVVALSRCEHPNVVKILDYGTVDGTSYYAMEYVEGAPLSAVAQALPSSGDLGSAISDAAEQIRTHEPSRFAHIPSVDRAATSAGLPGAPTTRGDRWRHLATLFHGAAEGLHHLHERGIVHRDVKPDNIVVTASDHRAVVMDLGLAQLTDASQSLTQADHGVLGTLRYMPPEQLRMDLADIDRRVDIYALGATLYELATERPLLGGDSVARLVDQILNGTPVPPTTAAPSMPEDLGAILSKATAKDAEDRYRDARALATDLQAFARGEAVGARPATLGYLLRLAVRRHKALATGLALGLITLVGGTVLFIQHLRDVRDREVELRETAQDSLARAEQLTTSLREETAKSEAARAKAEGHLRRAEDLAQFMLGDLSTDLRRLGKLPLLTRAAEKAKVWYDELSTVDASWSVLKGRAQAYANVAAVLIEGGDLPAAEAALKMRQAILAERLAAHPHDTEANLEMAAAEKLLAHCADGQGNLDASGELVRASLARYEAIPEAERTDSIRLAHARSEGSLGEHYVRRGKLPEAITQMDAAITMLRTLPATDNRRDPVLSRVLHLRGRIKLHQGLVEEGERDVTTAVTTMRAVVERERHADDVNTKNLEHLADMLTTKSRVARARDERTEEIQLLDEALLIRERLNTIDATQAEWQSGLAESYLDRGRRLMDERELEQAVPWLKKAAGLLEKLAEADPTNGIRGYNASIASYYLAMCARMLGDLDGALAHLERQASILRRLRDGGDQDPDIAMGLLSVATERHALLMQLDRVEEGRALSARSLEDARALAAKDPSNAEWQDSLCQAIVMETGYLLDVPDLAGAAALFEEALAIRDRKLAADPDDVTAQAQRIGRLIQLARVRSRQGRFDDADQVLRRAERLMAAQEDLPGIEPLQSQAREARRQRDELAAAAPLERGEATPITAEQFAVLVRAMLQRERWDDATAYARKMIERGEGALPESFSDWEPLVFGATRALRGKAPASAQAKALERDVFVWLRAALEHADDAAREALLARVLDDPLYTPLRDGGSREQVLRGIVDAIRRK